MSFQVENIFYGKAQLFFEGQFANAIDAIYSKWVVRSAVKNEKITFFATVFFANNLGGVYKQGSSLYYNVSEFDGSFGKKTLKKNTVSVFTVDSDDVQGYSFSSKNISRPVLFKHEEICALEHITLFSIQEILQEYLLGKHKNSSK